MNHEMKKVFFFGRSRVIVTAFALSCFSFGALSETTDYDRFRLFSNCTPMRLVVEDLPEDALEIGLTKNAIRATVESRLRSARLYGEKALSPYIYINVTVVGRAFSLSLKYDKMVRDIYTNQLFAATTWDSGSAGTHGGNAGYILSWVSQHMDQFLVEFLRVNEETCEEG